MFENEGMHEMLRSSFYFPIVPVFEFWLYYVFTSDEALVRMHDKTKHCIISCAGAKWSPGGAEIAGVFKELIEPCIGGTMDIKDLEADHTGIYIAILGLDCVDTCISIFGR